MEQENRHRVGFLRSLSTAVITVALISVFGPGAGTAAAAEGCSASQACWDPPYPNMPDIAPPMVRTSKYLAIPASEQGPAIDAAKGYRVQSLGSGAYMVTDGVYQMMLLVHNDGVLLADAPPSIGAKITQAVEEVAAGKKITHLLYSHAHADHIDFAGELKKANPAMKIVAHEETNRILARAKDPRRPLPTETFDGTGKKFTVKVGGQSLQLEYPGPNHQPGNIEIYHAESKTLMLVDVVFPGWMMWRRLALAQDIPGYFEVVRNLNGKYDFTVLIAGHLNRAGTKADVANQLEFLGDLHAAASQGLASTKLGETMNPEDLKNPWAVFDNYIDRVTIYCVNKLTPKWKDRLAGYDVYIYDQCMSMEQSLRIDGPSM